MGLAADLRDRRALLQDEGFLRLRELRCFIRFRSFPSQGSLAENSNFKRSSFQGAEQTDEGSALYPVLCESFDRIAHAVTDLKQQEKNLPLTISVTVAFASLWLMRRLPDLVRQTGLTLNVEADNRPVDLSSSDVDCAIRYALQPSPEGHWLPLFEDRVIPLCAPELVQEQLPQDDFDILRLPLIEYRWALGKNSAPSWRHWAQVAGLQADAIPVAQQYSEEINAIDAALAGQGVVLASSVLTASARAVGRLVCLSKNDLPGRVFWAVS